jgi:hypothetical protein
MEAECPLFLPSPTVVLWHSIAFQLYQNNSLQAIRGHRALTLSAFN